MTDAMSRALDELIERFRGAMARIGQRHGVDDADLDEVFQQVRIRIWQAVGDAERIARLPASYVYRTVRAVVVDRMRRRRARGEDMAMNIEDANEAFTAKTDPDPVEQDEAVRALERAIDRLVESRRGVVRMYLEGYSQREIGDLLGWSEPKTRNLMYRGLADLRAILAAEGGE
jgi:RNA polymerase sigma-70 factor (ECF subfamily)